MKIWVGVTDESWFELLSRRRPDEVNFWQPSGGRRFSAIDPGEPFLFKLHSPKNFIVGGGHFVRHSPLPASLAWDAFGEKNGVATYRDLIARVRHYRRQDDVVDPIIGCNVLAEPFFLPRERWIPAPASWAPNIVQGKTYDSATAEGAALWDAVCKALPQDLKVADQAAEAEDVPGDRYGPEYLRRGRLGQGAFRVLVIDAYQRRCAVTGERTLPVLEAAHIKPYASEGPHQVRNGLLLRSDLHKLFDGGYLTVTPDYRLEVSPRLREEWQNGREYYAHHGKTLGYMPIDVADRPDAKFLRWHNEERFKT